jgi:hypothetical protein
MRSDSLDVSSLISYINDIKPFHTKLTSVLVEYQANDNLFAEILDAHTISTELSSVWQDAFISDGQRTRYRIPATVFPRSADSFHQSVRRGVTDAVPGRPATYLVPYNNGITVTINGIEKYENSDFSISKSRSKITFFGNSIPVLNDIIDLNWMVIDRFFIGIGATEYDYASADDGIDMFPMDLSNFDSAISTYSLIDWVPYDLEFGSDINGIGTDFADETQDQLVSTPQYTAKIGSIGYVKTLLDSVGQQYFVFDFNVALPLNSKIWLRVEQREAYNGWTQTSINETLKISDGVKFADSVNVRIADPNNWTNDIDLFGVDLNLPVSGYFDYDMFDRAVYDSTIAASDLSYYTLFTINEIPRYDAINTSILAKPHSPSISDVATQRFNEQLAIHVVYSGHYDVPNYDVGGFDDDTADDITATVIAMPDLNGIVKMTSLSKSIDILHSFNYHPLVAVYLNEKFMYPYSVTYPSLDRVTVKFSAPRMAIIRLA